jgi:inorganic pyrophosphatase
MNLNPYIGQTWRVVIDRPLGSRHPQYSFLYPINYGYLPGVLSDDGEDLDVYILGVSEPLITFIGVCIAVIHRLDDSDDKLVMAPAGQQFSDEQIRALTEFQERWFTSLILRS